MDFDAPDPSTNVVRHVGQAALFLATALVAGLGFAFLADSNGGSGDARVAAVTEVPYSAHLDVAPRADRLPKSQQAAPATPLQPGEDAAFADLVERALAETEVAKAPAVAPANDFGPMVDVPAPIPVARPQPPAPAIAQYTDPFEDRADALIPMEPVPQHELAAEGHEAYQPPRRKARPIDALGLPFEIVGRTVATLGNAVASIGNPDRRY
jgi:hypothetical protein